MIKTKLIILILIIINNYCFAEKSTNKFKEKGNNYYSQSNFDSALFYYNKALNFAEPDSEKATIYSNIGSIYEDLSNYNKALNFYKKSLETYRSLNNKQGISASLNQIGNVYYRWGDFENAIKYYDKGLKIRRKINDKTGIPSSLNNLGNIYYSWGKFKKALEYYLQAYNQKLNLNDQKELPSYIINIGSAYLSLKDYNNARKYYNLALEKATEQNNKHIISSCYINMGVLAFEQGNNSEALKYYKKAYNIISKTNSRLELAYVLRNIGEVYIKLKEYPNAQKYFNQSLKTAKQENLKTLISEIYMFLYQIEKENNNYKQALNFYIKSKNLNDSIFNKESSKKLNELQSKYEYEKKENEIKQKNLELTQKQKQIQLQRFWFTAIAGLIFILAIIIYLTYKNKTTKKRIELENALNQQMQKALSAQMNPHFISNALNSIQRYFLNNEIEIANEYLADFGALIRAILEHSRKSNISLAEEIKSIKLYMSLEALRLENKFTSEIKISSKIDINNIFIPPIIFQPYIENAIWHGIAPCKENGKIELFFDINLDYLICIIKDNGIGINKSNEIKKQYGKKHKSFGMDINHERIELLNLGYKNKFSVKITDLSNIDNKLHGTQVEIKIPYARN